MRVLVVNAGSSTLKLRVIGDDDGLEQEVDVDPWDGDDATARDSVVDVVERAAPVDAVGHRVVHGGRELTDATVVDDDVETRLAALSPLAPLHQPRALSVLAAARRVLPECPHVACFDTAFHATMPDTARTYALPESWRTRWGLDRFGFHGLSHVWAARRARELTDGDGDGSTARPARRVVTCHLGAGSSLCAVLDGRSVDTTMGFTPVEGLVMAARSGSVDPGLLLWLLTDAALDAREVRDGIERHGGLAALSGTSGDMREVLAARSTGDSRASLAFGVFVHRLRREIAAMCAALDGLDVLVFTGGIGEHSPAVRDAATGGLGFLGVAIDPVANDEATGDAEITAPGAAARTVVVEAREDLEIARQVRQLLQ